MAANVLYSRRSPTLQPLDMYGQPVRQTKPVGPRRVVYHRIPAAQPTGTNGWTSGNSGGGRDSIGVASASSVSWDGGIDPATNSTWYTKKAANGGFRMKGLNKHWYNETFDPTLDPRNSATMGEALVREQLALRIGVAEQMRRIAQSAPSSAIETKDQQRPNPNAATSPPPPPLSTSSSLPPWVDPHRAIIKVQMPAPTVATLLHADDKTFVDSSPVRRRRERLESMHRAQHETLIGVRPLLPGGRLPGVEEYGYKRKTTTIERPAEVSDDVKRLEKRTFERELHALSHAQSPALIDCRSETSPSRVIQHTCGIAGGGAGSSSAAASPSAEPISEKAAQFVPEAMSPQRMPNPVWATVDRARSYVYQRQAAQRRYCDEMAMKQAMRQMGIDA